MHDGGDSEPSARAAAHSASSDVDPRQIVTDMAFRVDPQLLGADLASPWRRWAALLVDLVISGVVSALGGAGVAAALAATVGYRVLAGVGERSWAFFRSAGAAFASLLIFAITLAILSGGPDPDDVDRRERQVAALAALREAREHTASATTTERQRRTLDAVNGILGALKAESSDAERQAIAEVVGDIAASVESLTDESSLAVRIKALQDENERLREELDAPSVLRTVRAAAADFGLTFGWVGAYFTLLLAWLKGATPGKRLLSIRVYRLDGRPLSLWLSFERFAGYAAGLATGLLGFVQIFWDPNRQAIQDRIAGTVVVRMDGNEPRRRWLDLAARRQSRPSRLAEPAPSAPQTASAPVASSSPPPEPAPSAPRTPSSPTASSVPPESSAQRDQAVASEAGAVIASPSVHPQND